MAEHADHDLEVLAAAADRSGRLDGFMAACAECLGMVTDLRALAAATPGSAIPRRPHDYRLTMERAVRLRRRGWRRLLEAVGTSRDAISRPLALSLTTLGLAGMLLASVPAGLPFAAADQRDLAAPVHTVDVLDSEGSGMAMQPTGGDGAAVPPAGPVAGDPAAPDGTPLRVLSLTFLGLAAGISVIRRAASTRRGMR